MYLLSGSVVCVHMNLHYVAYNILKYFRLSVTPVPEETRIMLVKIFKEKLDPTGKKFIIWSQPGVAEFCMYDPDIRPVCPHCNITFASSNALIDHLFMTRNRRGDLWTIEYITRRMKSTFNENTSIVRHTGSSAQMPGSYSFGPISIIFHTTFTFS